MMEETSFRIINTPHLGAVNISRLNIQTLTPLLHISRHELSHEDFTQPVILVASIEALLVECIDFAACR